MLGNIAKDTWLTAKSAVCLLCLNVTLGALPTFSFNFLSNHLRFKPHFFLSLLPGIHASALVLNHKSKPGSVP